MQLTNYISTGYFITVATKRPDFVDAKLMPESIVSLSSCFGDFFPGAWILEWCGTSETERARIGKVLGIGTEQRLLATAELDDAIDDSFGWESVIFDFETACEYRKRYFSAGSAAKIFGTALHRELVGEFIEAGTPTTPLPGESPVATPGAVQAAARNLAPATGGTVLGFEPMAFDRGQPTCSWLCNGLEKLCAEKLQIVPNAKGFIDGEQEAARCVQLIGADETGAEPGLWLPWLLIEYPESC